MGECVIVIMQASALAVSTNMLASKLESQAHHLFRVHSIYSLSTRISLF